MNFSQIFARYFVLILFLCISIGVAGQTSQPVPVRVSANLMILDKDNQFIENIKAEDLIVYEDDIEQKIETFTVLPTNLSVILLVDNSGSLRPKIDQILKAAGTIAINLGDNDESALIRFVGRDTIEILQDWTFSKKALLSGIDALYVEGGQTVVHDAMFLAIEKANEKKKLNVPRRFAVIMISDAADRSSYYSEKQLFELVDRSGIEIYSLAFVGDLSDRRDPYSGISNAKTYAIGLVQQLALRSSGNSYLLDTGSSGSDIQEAIRSTMIELRSRYAFSYISTNANRDGVPRKLRVEMKDKAADENLKIVVRPAVIVPPDRVVKTGKSKKK